MLGRSEADEIGQQPDGGPKPSSRERRRPGLVRTEVCLRAKLLREDQTDLDVRLCNLSAAGFMAECLEPVQAGSKVILSLPGAGLIPAEVRWNVDFRLGAIFQWELSARELGLFRSETSVDVHPSVR